MNNIKIDSVEMKKENTTEFCVVKSANLKICVNLKDIGNGKWCMH